MSLIPGVIASGISGHLGGNYTSIATQTVGSGGASSVTFSSIPNTYTHLQIRAIAIVGSSAINPLLTFNGDSGSNYSWHQMYGSGSSAGASASASYTGIGGPYTGHTQFGPQVWDILDYTNTNKNKTVRVLGGSDENGSGYVGLNSGLWINTAAITSINISSVSLNFNQYTTFALYGVK